MVRTFENVVLLIRPFKIFFWFIIFWGVQWTLLIVFKRVELLELLPFFWGVWDENWGEMLSVGAWIETGTPQHPRASLLPSCFCWMFIPGNELYRVVIKSSVSPPSQLEEWVSRFKLQETLLSLVGSLPMPGSLPSWCLWTTQHVWSVADTLVVGT